MNRQPDMRQIMAQAQKMQEQLAAAQQELAGRTFEGSAGGGMVVATVTGAQELVDLTISSEVVDPDDVEMLQDLVLAAVRQAFEAASNAASEELGGLTGGLGLGGLLGSMFEGPVQRLIDEMSRPPGIGQKTAQRLAFHLLSVEEADARRLATAINDMRDQVTLCERCFNVAAGEQCVICRDSRRDNSLVCVVERPQDIVVVERTQGYRGLYHVLGGSLSPINGVGPGQLRIGELRDRLDREAIEELIVATNPTVEGDATAMYLARELKPLGVKVTRLASGLPVGGDLDYADELTLGRALVGRMEL